MNGVDNYRFIDDIEKNYEDRIGDVRKKLQKTLDILLHRDNLMVDITGSKEMTE